MKAMLPASLKKVSSRADRTYDLTFSTRELSGEEAAFLLDEVLSEGWLMYARNTQELSSDEIPKDDADSGVKAKSPSQRLRNAIYVLFTQRGSKGSFENFYNSVMEQFIENIKDKLE